MLKSFTNKAVQTSFRLVSESTIPFTIERSTGNIRVSNSIDYEREKAYNFTVVAEDSGSPTRLRSYVNVMVNITDLNDNSPVISRNHTNVIVQEGQFVFNDYCVCEYMFLIVQGGHSCKNPMYKRKSSAVTYSICMLFFVDQRRA